MYSSIGEVRINYFQCDFFTEKVTPAPYLAREEPYFQSSVQKSGRRTPSTSFVSESSTSQTDKDDVKDLKARIQATKRTKRDSNHQN
jgi:hypothetical protein